MKKAKIIMQLKTKNTIFLTFIFMLVTIIVSSQEKRIKLNGTIKYNAKALENINVINKTQKTGSVSNSKGEFTVYAIKGDSVEFSSIEYQNRTIEITEHIISENYITVYLEPGFNELDEVAILQNMRLGVDDISVQQNTKLDIDEMDLAQAPDSKDLSGYNTQLTNGMDLVGIYNLLTKNKRAKKRTENDIKNEIDFIKRELPNTLRTTYGDDFFTEWLNLENDEIYEFLDFCQANGLGELYDSDEIYIKDFLIKQSVVFNQIKNEE